MHWWRFSTIVVTCALFIGLTVVPAAAEEREQREGESTYLALGDSVAFGTNPLLDRGNAANFVGYPEVLAKQLELNLTNAACPGEASGGFISLTGTDNVCRPYRGAFPLHVSYTTSQLDFAVSYLGSHRHTRLVTLNIGANDLFVLQRQCNSDTTCVLNGLPAMLQTLSANLGTIYGGIRGDAHYRHQLVGLTYYSTDYRNQTSVSVLQAINNTVAQATVKARGKVADGFGKFKAAAQAAGGDACAAGLLIETSTKPLTCDIHPSPKGQALLAEAIADALRQSEDD
jgi:lysophospholipase L1-like esterase